MRVTIKNVDDDTYDTYDDVLQAHEDALRKNQSYNNMDRYSIPESSGGRRY